LTIFSSNCNALTKDGDEFDTISSDELFESDKDVAVAGPDLNNGEEAAVDVVDEKIGLE